MKRVLLLLFLAFFLTGCTNIKKRSIDEIITYAFNSEEIEITNTSSSGYNYYLPKGLNIESDKGNSVVFKNEKYTLYMYVDFISYYHKKEEDYKINIDAFYSRKLQNKEKFGYLEINLKEKNKYLIEIMYNYAKIEVIVGKKDINEVLSYAMAILSSISYKDAIIENKIGEDNLNYSEIEFNIFETTKNENNLIEYNESTTTKKEVPDTDLIN